MTSSAPSPQDPKLCDPGEMIAQVRAGDLGALDRMTRCYGERLLAVGRRYCRDHDQAQDAVQDALLAAGQHLQAFRGDGSLEGWLIRMVANACHRMRRGRKNDPTLHVSAGDADSGFGSAGEDSPEEAATRLELAEALGEAMLGLEPQDRLILLLAEAQDWSGPQIAEELGMTPGAVRTRLTRARARMRSSLVASGADL